MICPVCGGDCKLLVTINTETTIQLPDRLMALDPVKVTVVCLDCDLHRYGTIEGLDVNRETGRLEFGEIHLFND